MKAEYKILLEPPNAEDHSSKSQSYASASDMIDPELGLTTEEAENRLSRDGPNEIKEQSKSDSSMFFKCFWGPMPVLIWSACVLELIRVSLLNFSCLLVLQFVNGVVWYIEDKNSSSALETIKKSLEPNALVKRDGVWHVIKSSLLVVGDRIQITSGDFLPADCILGPGECIIDQSMLTGETVPVQKSEGAKVYMGSICKKGEIEAIVTATGVNTFFGKTNLLSSQVNQKGKIEKVLGKVAFLLMIITSIIVTVILIVFLVKGNEFLESFSSSVVLMVLSLPIAMQAVSATTLAVGAKGLNKKQAIVCRLASIEELAGLQILCLHKSAIFTKDEPTVHNPVLFRCKTIQKLFLFAFLSSKRDSKNAVDRCVCEYALETCKISHEMYEEEDFFQYDPRLKKSEAIFRNVNTGSLIKCCKGAPDVILAMTGEWGLEDEINKNIKKLAEQGYTCIAVASTDKHDVLKFRGIIPVFDPLCEDVVESIKEIVKMNVKITLLTGDSIFIAKQFCNYLALGDVIFTSEILNNDTTTVQRELIDSILLNADGFSDVYPEHKFTIVKMLQNKKKKVGITGIAVSDAAALKKANVGIAGFNSTDAAKSAADIIINKPGLKVISQSISKARKIFQRAKTYCLYRISCSFQLLSFFFISLVSINPKQDFVCSGHSSCNDIPNTFGLPVIGIVLIALLNDGTIISISHDRVKHSLQPCSWNLGKIFLISCSLGAISFFSSYSFLLLCLSNMDENSPNLILNYFQIPTFSYGEVLTCIFLKVSISNYLTLFSVRTNGLFFLCMPGKALFFTGLAAMSISTVVSKFWVLNIQPKNSVLIASLSSISWAMILFIWVFSIFIFILQDLIKILIHKCFHNNKIENDNVLQRMIILETARNFGKPKVLQHISENNKELLKI